MVMLPDGRRYWPLVGAYHFRDIAPVSQYQLIQHGLEEIEVRLVVESTISAAQEDALQEIIQATLGYPFQLSFTYFERELPRGANGKFEEFVCRVQPT
jgi:phenylacetate-CoA ligase